MKSRNSKCSATARREHWNDPRAVWKTISRLFFAVFLVAAGAGCGRDVFLSDISPDEGFGTEVVRLHGRGLRGLVDDVLMIDGQGLTSRGDHIATSQTDASVDLDLEDAAMAPGAHEFVVRVEDGEGTLGGYLSFGARRYLSNPQLFFVNNRTGPKCPRLGRINSGAPSDPPGEVTVTLTGQNFVSPATILISGDGVTAGNPTVDSDTQISVVFSIDPNAETGVHEIRVQTAGGPSNRLPFIVHDSRPKPRITALMPNFTEAGKTPRIQMRGENFETGIEVVISDEFEHSSLIEIPPSIVPFEVFDQARLNFSVRVPRPVEPGYVGFRVRTLGGTSDTSPFLRIVPPGTEVPRLDSASLGLPGKAVKGSTIYVECRGVHFARTGSGQGGAGAEVFGRGVSNIGTMHARFGAGLTDRLVFFLVIEEDAGPIATIAVRTPDGFVSAPVILPIDDPVPDKPFAARVLRSNVSRGSEGEIVIAGRKLHGARNVSFSIPGLSLMSVHVNADGTEATLRVFAASDIAYTYERATNLCVGGLYGTSNPIGFRIQ